jgi:hypothetical protein
LGLEDKYVEVRNAKFGVFSVLWDEFGFESQSEPLTAFQQSLDLEAGMENFEARLCLSGVEKCL